MTVPIRNHDIAELKRLDLAHHLPAQADHKVIAELGGSRIITRAEGCHITDGEGHRILDGMTAARFALDVVGLLEHPAVLALDDE